MTIIGQVALSWNDLCNRFANLFWIILGAGFSPIPLAAWNSIPADRTQRNMLRAAAKAALPYYRIETRYPTALADVDWLIVEAGKLEDVRNDAIHSPLLLLGSGGWPAVGQPIMIEPAEIPLTFQRGSTGSKRPSPAGLIIPDYALANPRALKLAQKDLLPEFRWCRDTAIALRDYCDRVADALVRAPTMASKTSAASASASQFPPSPPNSPKITRAPASIISGVTSISHAGLSRPAASTSCAWYVKPIVPDFGHSKIGTGSCTFRKNFGFTPAPPQYCRKSNRVATIADRNPFFNLKYCLFVAAWKRLRLRDANFRSPHIVPGIV